MIEQILSIEQMQHLKSIGFDVTPNGMSLIYTCDGEDDYYLRYGESTCEDDIRTITFQDIIEFLNGTITVEINGFEEDFILIIEKRNDNNYSISYENDNSFLVGSSTSDILTCAYNMLVLCIENKYLTNKQK